MAEHGAIFRRLQQLVGIGRTSAPADDAGAVQRQQVTLQPDAATRDDTIILQVFGLSSSAPVGSDVVVLFLGGDRSKGVVVATGNQAARFRNLQPGEAALHNSSGMSVHLSADGIRINGGGKPVTITNATKLRAECPIESTGDITARVGGAAVHLATHGHPDPQGGTIGLPDSR